MSGRRGDGPAASRHDRGEGAGAHGGKAGNANRVRIIGGSHRGRIVRFDGEPGLRPTPDRVRETLFNWLGQDLAGWRTLEPYAGSGVLSLEALSRGATLAVAVDRSAAVVERLRANAAALGLAGLEARRGDAEGLLAQETRSFDAIFLDPPFGSDPWARILALAAARLGEAGFVYAEAAHALEPPAASRLVVHRQGRAGQVHYHLLRRAPG